MLGSRGTAPRTSQQLALPLSAPGRRFDDVTDAAAIHTAERQKELGAFYTPPAIAACLTEWAVRSPDDRVLDPSFGGLVFLAAARQRLELLGASGEAIRGQLFGVDLDEDAHAVARASAELDVPSEHLLERDFFDVNPDDLPAFEAVIGNPPYVRYQGFNGTASRARELAAASGVKLTRLASSWAPFVVHGTSFVAQGGRLAQVLPAELLHAQYAGEIVEFLRRSFGRVLVAVFEERVFPGALEEVVLLFAEDRGANSLADVHLIACDTVDDVKPGLASSLETEYTGERRRLGRGKLLSQLLPASTRQLHERLSADDRVWTLGELASVDIGIVTGANDFFVVPGAGPEAFDPALLRPAVCKAAQVAGATLSVEDHHALVDAGQRALIFVADSKTPARLLEEARPYLERGEELGMHERYKCRIRDPWWAIPLPKDGPPALLLTYCSNEYPRLAVNEARALNTNTLHGVRPANPEQTRSLAAGFYNSLTLLSAELVGRSYGGGVLKLEPTEAEALVMPPLVPGVEDLLPEIDRLVRSRQLSSVLDLVDPVVLGSGLGLSTEEIQHLRSGRERLTTRRRARGKPPARR